MNIFNKGKVFFTSIIYFKILLIYYIITYSNFNLILKMTNVISGQLACPPEMEKGHTTNFGPREYYILTNPKHEDHKTMQQIFSNSYDAYNFDPASVTFS